MTSSKILMVVFDQSHKVTVQCMAMTAVAMTTQELDRLHRGFIAYWKSHVGPEATVPPHTHPLPDKSGGHTSNKPDENTGCSSKACVSALLDYFRGMYGRLVFLLILNGCTRPYNRSPILSSQLDRTMRDGIVKSNFEGRELGSPRTSPR
jgi:hypothetical protein